jgi:hypothetical protein
MYLGALACSSAQGPARIGEKEKQHTARSVRHDEAAHYSQKQLRPYFNHFSLHLKHP